MAEPAQELSAEQQIAMAGEDKILEFKPKNGTQPASEAAPTEKPKGVKSSEILEQGSATREITFPNEVREQAINRLTSRINTLKEMQTQGNKLSEVDRMIIESDVIDRLQTGELSKNDLGIIWFSLQDEQLQKSMAVGQLAQNRPAQFQELQGRLFKRYKAVDFPPETELKPAETPTRMSTGYLDHIAYSSRAPEVIEQDLYDLNDLRLSVEESLFEDGYHDPLFEQQATAGFPLTLDRATSNRMQLTVYRQTQELLRERGLEGKPLAELFRENPAQAFEVFYEANRRALPVFAQEVGVKILKDKPPVENVTLKAHAAELRKQPKPEDLTPLEEAKTQSAQEFTEAGTKLNTFKSEKDRIEQGLPELRMKRDEAHAEFTARQPALAARITNLDTIVTALYNDFNDPARVAGLSKDAAASFKADTSKTLERYNQQLENANNTLDQLVARETSTASAVANREARLTELNGTAIPAAQTELGTKKTALAVAEADIKTKQETQKKGSPENNEKADAIESWNKLLDGDNYEKIIDARFSQGHAGEYTKSRLASATESHNQIEGAEAIREHIFKLVDPVNYNPEQARKMLSDETIARAIIYNFQINTSAEDPSHPGITLQMYLDDLRDQREVLDGIPVRNTQQKAIAQEALRNTEKALANALLPRLATKSEFELGGLIRFLSHEGLKSAANGDPYLNLSNERFLKVDQEVRETQTPESIIEQDLGKTEITDKNVAWEGQTHFTWANSREFGTPLQLTTRIDQTFGRDDADHGYVDYAFAVKVDQRLLESLPEVVNPTTPSIPEEIRQVFYDINGNLRQELRPGERLWQFISRGPAAGGVPEWIRIAAGKETDNPLTPASTGNDRATAKFYDTLNTRGGMTQIDTVAKSRLAASVAETVVNMNPTQRKGVLKGTSVRFRVDNVPLTAGPTGAQQNYEIDIDTNGNILIGESGALPRQELSAFYAQRLREVQAVRGTTLSEADRNALRDEYMRTLTALGRQVLIGQERKQ